MLNNFFRIAFRNIIRNPFFSFINIFGLTVGITSALLILLLIIHEISYDRFHENAENIYRIGMDLKSESLSLTLPIAMTPLGPEIQRTYPAIISFTRISKPRTTTLFSFEEKKFYEEGLLYADSGFFKTFSFELIRGNPDEVLKLPYSIVLTEETARKYFGDQDPIGQSLLLNNQYHFTITGLVKDPPYNSHFRFTSLGSFSTLYDWQGGMENWVGNLNYFLYVRIQPGTTTVELYTMADELIQKNAGEILKESGYRFAPMIIKITDIHLHSAMMGELGMNSSVQYVRIFLAIAVFILIIASINYMNLSTARFTDRAREVGIKKVSGAQKSILVRQFLGESVLLCLIIFLISLFLIELLLPAFSRLMGKNLEFSYLKNPQVLLIFFGIAIIIGIFSGSYPSFYLASFNAFKVLKGELTSGIKALLFRNIMVVLQFFLALVLIICSLLVNKQLNYMINKDLGFNKDQILIVPLRSEELRNNYQKIKQEIKKLPFVINVSASQNYPGAIFSGNLYEFTDSGSTEKLGFSSIDVDEDFLQTYEMDMKIGRNFSKDFSTDDMALIISETARQFMGWDDPLGKQAVFNNIPGYTIIGVVKDFYFAPLREKLEPVILSKRDSHFRYLNIKIFPENIDSNLKQLAREWEVIDPGKPFDYFFLGGALENLYENENRMFGMLGFFTTLAIIIALLGLYGLSAFITEQRTKEIGIRKVMGATASGITVMLTGNFLRLVLIGIIMGIPAGYLIMNRWLENFAYRTIMPVWISIIACVALLLVVLITVSFQSVRSAFKNPADSLRYE